METKTFKVPNIGCAGCVSKIQSELAQITGVTQIDGDPQTKIITVQWQAPASWSSIENHLVEIDYSPSEA
jgi:copper chaperone CopZ